MKFLHTDQGHCEHKIKRLETVLDKGLIINWKVSWHTCVMSTLCKLDLTQYGCISMSLTILSE